MIKLELYRVFCEVAKQQSLSKAAAVLYMTQPAVSQAIAQLERDLGLRLFTRTSKGVILTNEGKLLYEYANSAINLIKKGEEKLEEWKNLSAGELKIGVGDTISRHYLLPYLEKFHSLYSNIKLKIINKTTLELCALVKSGEIDIAICNLPIEDPALEIMKIMDIHDIFVCGNLYRNKLPQVLSLEQLANLPLILLEPKSNSRLYVEKFFLSKGISIKPEIELGSHDLLLEFARINLGISCVIREFSQEYLKKKELFEIKINENIPKRNIGICFLKSVSLSPTSERFVQILGKY
ncbi:LysR family transcriptional regulator [Lutispora thermophila]|uniref:DNA-binding transcriptional regulator, LysR family n=1 Tax=Lutispora thermophila DSM 19022 TaxID=1122184 RepID=A0A1M6H3C3_9FIRM|nr:LysR family transcriptional regulator [Lutispora thermophila]SHJ16652.1 DNA-binding transcriptional regulator, LysR family [Lutispora thermophila DSM 19022]